MKYDILAVHLEQTMSQPWEGQFKNIAPDPAIILRDYFISDCRKRIGFLNATSWGKKKQNNLHIES